MGLIVTPCVGVWIEILMYEASDNPTFVTPCVGVWIEIVPLFMNNCKLMSLPAWECGLK